MKKFIPLILLLVVLALVWYGLTHKQSPAEPAPVTPTPSAPVGGTAPAHQDLSQSYADKAKRFSIRYPARFKADATYQYQLTKYKTITGVKFTIDPALAKGTNLGSDSYISVEQIPEGSTCTADRFFDDVHEANEHKDGGVTYSVASSSGAGAGNRYNETVYAIPGSDPCIAVRYFVHYSLLANYPDGSVKEFDEAALMATFDAIRHSLVVNQ